MLDFSCCKMRGEGEPVGPRADDRDSGRGHGRSLLNIRDRPRAGEGFTAGLA